MKQCSEKKGISVQAQRELEENGPFVTTKSGVEREEKFNRRHNEIERNLYEDKLEKLRHRNRTESARARRIEQNDLALRLARRKLHRWWQLE
jgi:hypothetical protein